ncbi:HK97 gp10 family phage protein [Williamsia sterculiae]|uniref:Phage protein, HK97 gp10 family n=1 Tax=Williamsia sterculiae TaxID=1344003 RepID=A0A1N7GFN3_9NOCA|nr:HK97 gp10 family phage protein [Williamsia sterculiae]SIS11370.1 phage protein, HK97 gp10 family [Williamsia sterculiae]
MDAVQFNIKIDQQQVADLFRRAPAAAVARFSKMTLRNAIRIQREMRERAGVGVTGDLRRSVTYTIDTHGLSAEIRPTASYAEAVEWGSPPRHVSAAPGTPLARWADQKGLNPYAVQASIAAKGTVAHPFIRPTYDAMRPVVERDMADDVAAFVREMNNGRV